MDGMEKDGMEKDVFKRSRLGAYGLLLGGALLSAFLIWTHWPTDPIITIEGQVIDLGPKLGGHTIILLLVWGLAVIGGVILWRNALYNIEVTSEGLLDKSSLPHLVRWEHISDVDLSSDGKDLVLTLKANLQKHRIRLDGIEGGANSVYDVVLSRWLAREALQEGTQGPQSGTSSLRNEKALE